MTKDRGTITFENAFGTTISTFTDADLNKKWSLGGNPSTKISIDNTQYLIGNFINPLTGLADPDAFVILPNVKSVIETTDRDDRYFDRRRYTITFNDGSERIEDVHTEIRKSDDNDPRCTYLWDYICEHLSQIKFD